MKRVATVCFHKRCNQKNNRGHAVSWYSQWELLAALRSSVANWIVFSLKSIFAFLSAPRPQNPGASLKSIDMATVTVVKPEWFLNKTLTVHVFFSPVPSTDKGQKGETKSSPLYTVSVPCFAHPDLAPRYTPFWRNRMGSHEASQLQQWWWSRSQLDCDVRENPMDGDPFVSLNLSIWNNPLEIFRVGFL